MTTSTSPPATSPNPTTRSLWVRPSNIAFLIGAVAGIIVAGCQVTSKCPNGTNVFGLIGAVLAAALGIYDRTIEAHERRTWASTWSDLATKRSEVSGVVKTTFTEASKLLVCDLMVGSMIWGFARRLRPYMNNCVTARYGDDYVALWRPGGASSRGTLGLGMLTTTLMFSAGPVAVFVSELVALYSPEQWQRTVSDAAFFVLLLPLGLFLFVIETALVLAVFIMLRLVGHLIGTIRFLGATRRIADKAAASSAYCFDFAQKSPAVTALRYQLPIMASAMIASSLVDGYDPNQLEPEIILNMAYGCLLISPAPLGFCFISAVWVLSFLYFGVLEFVSAIISIALPASAPPDSRA